MTDMPHVQDTDSIKRALRLVERGTMPSEVTARHLAANGFTEDDAPGVLAFLQELDFVSPTGVPTSTWVGFRESDDRIGILAEAVRSAYAPFFAGGDAPPESPDDVVPGATDQVLATFAVLCEIAEITGDRASRTGPRERHAVVTDIGWLLQASVTEFEAARVCLRNDLMRPAFVAAWNSYVAMAFAHLSGDDFAVFRTSSRRSGLAPADLLRRVGASELIGLLLAQEVISADDRLILERLLEQRDDCAHPTPFDPSREDTAAYLSAILGQSAVLTEHPLV